ncbi:sorbitol dehydrogenase [Arthrobacter globiformis NBRC 12137]|uniref:Sorbitol dehydrogenase n=1 Tax=Arthrobacter globiformis (strain ATCC 8010 / DSM 20124 / JCM 1332 / NBRC 12137 / NCIMB 8907 / NRRL B-2979 / 168) TaxID=1077972 RepID=H0QJT3_ARTG1|nr:NAD(P)-dependent alcohol dehydrogenase [Arthrobacter globiformis]GAB13084.1 sorbitol dehydrogenase [Arthrobacter globiformis NBRC 12137]
MTTQTIPATNTAGLPTGTQAAVLHGARDLRIEHKPLRALGRNDLLVEMRSGGICGSDMHYFADGRNGTNLLRQPTVLGHEGAGVVIAAGPQATTAAGTAVVIEPALPCRECPTCLSGRYNLCPAGTCFGSPPTNGLFARHVVVPEAAVHRLPDTIPAEIGAAIEPLAVAVWAVERAQVRKGHRVLITGAGPIGLLVAQVAAAQGTAEIVVTDVNDDRLAVAAKFGATRTINTATTPLDLTGMDRLIECSGNTRALADGLQTLAPAARATVVGQAKATVDGIPLGFLQRYEIDLVTAFRYANAFPAAIDLASSGVVDLPSIITSTFPLEDAAAALTAPVTDPTNLKVLITYPPTAP